MLSPFAHNPRLYFVTRLCRDLIYIKWLCSLMFVAIFALFYLNVRDLQHGLTASRVSTYTLTFKHLFTLISIFDQCKWETFRGSWSLVWAYTFMLRFLHYECYEITVQIGIVIRMWQNYSRFIAFKNMVIYATGGQFHDQPCHEKNRVSPTIFTMLSTDINIWWLQIAM